MNQNEFQSFNLASVKNMSPNQAREYINTYFYPTSTGHHAQLVDHDTLELKEEKVIKSVYFNRMEKSLSKYYFTERDDIREIVNELNGPTVTDSSINLCPKLLHKAKPYSSYDENTQQKVNLFLDYIKTVLANNEEDAFQYLLKWTANAAKGIRNNVALYLKGLEGTGKSTYFEFLRKYVFGNKLCYQGGSGPLKSNFNGELSNKILSIFEELESGSKGEWMQCGSVLKRIIDSSTIMIERKGIDSIEEKNMNNFVIISNHDAVKDEDGRKYFVLDINPKHYKDTTYYGNLNRNCSNNEVGEAFFSYLMEIDLNGFIPANYPKTNSKSDAKVKRLDDVHQFIKERYILRRLNIDRIPVEDLYQEYSSFCRSTKNFTKHKVDFNKMLSILGINYFKSGSTNYYKVSIETLNAIAKKFQWIGDLDVYENGFAEEPIDDDCIDYKTLYLKQQEEMEILKRHISELQGNIKVTEPVVEPEPVPKKKVLVKKIVKKIVKKPVLSDEDIKTQAKIINYNDASKNNLMHCLDLIA